MSGSPGTGKTEKAYAMHRTQDCKDMSVTTVCGRGADRRRAAPDPDRRGSDEPAAGSSPGAIISDPIPAGALAIGANFRGKAECRGRGYRAGRHHRAELRKQDRGGTAVRQATPHQGADGRLGESG